MAILVVDVSGKFLDINPEGLRMFGYTYEEMLSLSIASILPIQIHQDAYSDLKQVFEKGKVFGEYRSVRKNGVQFWMRVDAIQFSEDKLLAFCQDITDRKTTEDSLRRSENLFRTLTYTAPVGIYMTDISGKCIYVNEFWTKMTGLSEEMAMGNGWMACIHPDDRDMLMTN